MTKWVYCPNCWEPTVVEEEAPDPDTLEALESFRRTLERYRQKYEAGDVSRLPSALWYCLANNEPVPDWLRDAYVKAVHRVWSHEVSSWDDVFGKALKKGRQRKAAHRRYVIAEKIWQRVMDRTQVTGDRHPDKIDKNLFEEVGKEFGIKSTLAADIFYEHERWWVRAGEDDD